MATKISKRNIFVVGGAGFIGSHLSESLLSRGNRVVILDHAPFALSGVKAYKMDIGDAKKVDRIFKKERPEVVFHLAGAMHLRRSPQDPLFSKDLDFLSRTAAILDACKKYRVKKIMFVSSGGAIYENAKSVPTKETYPPSPNSLYGLANLMTEKYIEAYCKNNRMGFTILRVSNAYGPRQWQSGVIPSFILKIMKGERPVINGTGRQTRDFIYIDDLVSALILLAKKGKNEVYNVGSGQEISLKKVFELTKKLLGSNVKAEYGSPRFFEVQRSAPDNKKIKKELRWNPKTGMEEGLKKTIEWLKKNY